MKVRSIALAVFLGAASRTVADVVPEITTLAEGYNYIAKLPCINCPYLYQDTSTGENGAWRDRIDDNAILLNISLALDATHLSINNAPLLSSSSHTLPRIHATQVLQDYSRSDLDLALSSSTLDTTGPLLGLSYGTSLHSITNSSALVFRFNIFSAHFPLSSPPTTIALDAPAQKVLELIFMPRPLLSPADPGPGWEIVSARLRERDKKGSKRQMKIMMFEDWDEFGRKGSPGHLVSSSSRGVAKYASSGLWGLVVVILGAVVLFVVVVVACVVGWESYGGEYERAQGGKEMSRGNGNWTDVEKAKGRFLSASELGTRGAGKSD